LTLNYYFATTVYFVSEQIASYLMKVGNNQDRILATTNHLNMPFFFTLIIRSIRCLVTGLRSDEIPHSTSRRFPFHISSAARKTLSGLPKAPSL